jgi:hypothetical protein
MLSIGRCHLIPKKVKINSFEDFVMKSLSIVLIVFSQIISSNERQKNVPEEKENEQSLSLITSKCIERVSWTTNKQ